MRYRIGWISIICAILSVLLIGIIQFSQPVIIGADGYLHGRMALMLSEQGFLKRLPQAQYSWFNTDRFSDKDFLYHVYLYPFVRTFGYMTGTKTGAFAATAILYISVIYILSVYTGTKILPFMTAGLFLSAQFIRDTAEARPLVFALTLTVWGIHSILKKKPWAVLFVSLLYGMVHLSAFVLPVFAFLWLLVSWVQGKGGTRKIFVASVSGYIISFLLHPNFPNNIFFAYLNGLLVPIMILRGSILELGAEFFPLTTRDTFIRFPFLVAGFGIMILSFLVSRSKIRYESRIWVVAVLFFGVMGLFSVRNITHMYPIALIAFGSLLHDTEGMLKEVSDTLRRRVYILSALLFGGIAVFALTMTIPTLRNMMRSDLIYDAHFIRIAKVIEAQVPKGSVVFHTNWSDSQYLIGLAPEYRYIETLDPIYMYTYNTKLYTLYRSVSFGNVDNVYGALTKGFHSYYGYAGKNYFRGFIDKIRKDSRFSIIAEDELGLLYGISQKSSENKK